MRSYFKKQDATRYFLLKKLIVQQFFISIQNKNDLDELLRSVLLSKKEVEGQILVLFI